MFCWQVLFHWQDVTSGRVNRSSFNLLLKRKNFLIKLYYNMTGFCSLLITQEMVDLLSSRNFLVKFHFALDPDMLLVQLAIIWDNTKVIKTSWIVKIDINYVVAHFSEQKVKFCYQKCWSDSGIALLTIYVWFKVGDVFSKVTAQHQLVQHQFLYG